MAGFINKAINMFLGPEFDEEDLEYDELEEEEEVELIEKDTDRTRNVKRGTSSTIPSLSKVVSIHQTPKTEIVRTYPEVVADAFPICDYIRDNKTCIVNLEGVDVKEAQRIADFLGGVAYAFKGKIQFVSIGVFIVAPTTVEITGQLKEELKKSGVISPWIRSAGK